MSTWLLALTGLIYVGVAVDQYVKGAYGLAVVYAGYAIANAGFMFAVK